MNIMGLSLLHKHCFDKPSAQFVYFKDHRWYQQYPMKEKILLTKAWYGKPRYEGFIVYQQILNYSQAVMGEPIKI